LLIPVIPVINKWNKIENSIFPNNNHNSTAIINFNSKLDSTINLPRFTKFLRDITYLNTLSLDIFIGILLGDAYFKSGKGNNVRIGFKQSIINFPFFWTVFTQLSHYCSSIPRLEFTKLKNKKYGLLILETRSYLIFNQLYDLFIIEGKKGIKEELYHYLSPISLAYWIMCDGLSNQYGLTLCTDNFTVKDTITLINILKLRFNLDCSLHYYSKYPRIYVKASSMNQLRLIVERHIIPFSQYKLHKGRRWKNSIN